MLCYYYCYYYLFSFIFFLHLLLSTKKASALISCANLKRMGSALSGFRVLLPPPTGTVAYCKELEDTRK